MIALGPERLQSKPGSTQDAFVHARFWVQWLVTGSYSRTRDLEPVHGGSWRDTVEPMTYTLLLITPPPTFRRGASAGLGSLVQESVAGVYRKKFMNHFERSGDERFNVAT
jgi:hypothetical protein